MYEKRKSLNHRSEKKHKFVFMQKHTKFSISQGANFKKNILPFQIYLDLGRQ